jgi:hypothetical protein
VKSTPNDLAIMINLMPLLPIPIGWHPRVPHVSEYKDDPGELPSRV